MKTSLPVLPDDLPNRLGSLRLRHFRLVERLISEGTMHKAARTMNITQPAASLMLRELESAIGVSLFERSRRGMTATAAGMMLLDRARAILGEARFIAEQSRNDDSESRLLCVGASLEEIKPQLTSIFLNFGSEIGAIGQDRHGKSHETIVHDRCTRNTNIGCS